MSRKFFDKEVFECQNCEQRWVLISDKMITNDQHTKWMVGVLIEHFYLKKEKENEK